MTNKELQDYLKQLPNDAQINVEHCDRHGVSSVIPLESIYGTQETHINKETDWNALRLMKYVLIKHILI